MKVVFLLTIGTILSTNSFRSSNFDNEIEKYVTLLEAARTEAMANIDDLPHGVAVNPTDHPRAFVVFEGSSYASSSIRDVIEQQYPIETGAGSIQDVVFEQLSGDVDSYGTVLFQDKERDVTKTVTINSEGRINE